MTFLSILLLMSCMSSSVVASEKPSLKMVRTKVPPKIDGRLNDACWKVAPKTSAFVTNDGDKSSVVTYGYVCRDDNYLYIAFDCREPQIDKIIAKDWPELDGYVFFDDCVEPSCVDDSPPSRSTSIMPGAELSIVSLSKPCFSVQISF